MTSRHWLVEGENDEIELQEWSSGVRDQNQVSTASIHSLDWCDQENPVTLHRKKSVAASLTEVLMKGRHPHTQSSGLSLHEQSNFIEDNESEEVRVEDLFKTGKQKQRQQTNVRAAMGFWKLIWFDFKNWYRRWRVKNQETVILKTYIKMMESNFGSAIGSLFVFVRWVMFLNFLLAVMWMSFVIFPTAVCFDYDKIHGQFAFKNLIDGKGVLAQVWFFYGSYEDAVKGYHVGLAYLIMMLVTCFGSLFIILGSINQSKVSKSASAVSSRYRFALMMWTSWDYSITSNEASVNLSKGITSAFKDNLYEAKASQNVKDRSTKEKVKVYSLRILAWFITIILIGGGCTAIVYLVIFVSFEEVIPNMGSETDGNTERTDFLSVYGTTIVFSLINSLVPVCVEQLPKIEQYESGRDELNVTLTRVFVLRMCNLFALITSLYKSITKSVHGCAGTVLGQEMYKLVIMDTLLHSTVQLSVKFCKYYWTREKSEFKISSAVLVLVYRQALVWVGTLACPVMPLVGLASALIFFSVNYLIVYHTCKPPIKRWNQSRNTSFYSLFLLASLAMLIPPASVVIGSSDLVSLGKTNKPETYCGPFGSEKPTRAYTRFRSDQPSWITSVLGYLVSEPVLIPVFMILFSVMIHQKRRLSNGKKHMVVLQAELQQEREENEKLIKKLQSMGVGIERH
ncbi:transmembrane channel-like protein 1 isoform X3 [Mercenaria mercenaria]|uniref:transmembrane channel-like protein 1 isoform X3 n=1 Tax=Mercenaria mercenaria TaxID=6596 RepID=UPI00234F7648|nr:transmembrane channel-like protein 1 isoform X3 [Mercenaria mercenaria]